MAMMMLLIMAAVQLPSNSCFPLVAVSAWPLPIPFKPSRNIIHHHSHHHPLKQRRRRINTSTASAPSPLFMKEPQSKPHDQHPTTSIPTQSMAMMPATARKGKKNKRRRRFDGLFETLPRSANAICSNSMVNELADDTKDRIREYIIERCPGSAEIADALFWVAETYPRQLRTKELIETMEAMALMGASINVLLDERSSRSSDIENDNRNDSDTAQRNKQSMTIYDLACGHGLGGMLLAYRFPEVRVVCVDTERRPCWNQYIEAFEKFGAKSPGNDSVMANLEFRVGDITTTTTLQPTRGDYLVCIHGCNELSPHVLSVAREYRTGYAIMPCCIRDGLVGSVSSSSSGRNGGITDDKSRYAMQVGYLAGKFDCVRVAAISHRITNRFLIIIGDWS